MRVRSSRARTSIDGALLVALVALGGAACGRLAFDPIARDGAIGSDGGGIDAGTPPGDGGAMPDADPHHDGGVPLDAGDASTPPIDAGIDAPGDPDAGGGSPRWVTSGRYAGDSAGTRSFETPFAPMLVIIKGDTIGATIARTSTMPSGQSKEMGATNTFAGGRILSLDAAGFTIGADPTVNLLGVTYDWIAFAAVPGAAVAGTYTGDGTDARRITSVGFPPAFVIVLPEGSSAVHGRSSDLVGDVSFSFQGGPQVNRIQALLPNGFEVGSNASVNGSGVAMHYVAWSGAESVPVFGTYVGAGADDHRVVVPTGTTEYLIVWGESGANAPAHKSASTGRLADSTMLFSINPHAPDNIQALYDDGFQLGTHQRVNEAGAVFHYIAFPSR